MKILLVNPPIYDFTAYDFWLKPLGLLRVAGRLSGHGHEIKLYDFMDCRREGKAAKVDQWGRGPYPQTEIPKPEALRDIPRKYHRFGKKAQDFVKFLHQERNIGDNFDLVLMQITMTWWYPGAQEVIRTLHLEIPGARIVIGGPYAMLAAQHAKTLGADYICQSTDPGEIFSQLDLQYSDRDELAPWQLYEKLDTGAVKLTDGCPFSCTYCSVPGIYKGFSLRDNGNAIHELKAMLQLGARNIAFYDDALLHKAGDSILDFLDRMRHEKLTGKANLHTPNALNARLLDRHIAGELVRSGVKTFHLGLESSSSEFQNATGAKVFDDEFATAVSNLLAAGADPVNITAYMLLGHPDSQCQDIERSMRFANSLGVRIMAADFAPVPGTTDGEKCSAFTDMSEPLNHNKTAFAIRNLGHDEINRFKELRKRLNTSL